MQLRSGTDRSLLISVLGADNEGTQRWLKYLKLLEYNRFPYQS